jgi:putative salt-induced outer membrane protein YdiY
MHLQKHKRELYQDTNLVYIVTDEYNKKNRTYIIGKAKNLTNRLSTYNKGTDYEVIYYKSCGKANNKLIEDMV